MRRPRHRLPALRPARLRHRPPARPRRLHVAAVLPHVPRRSAGHLHLHVRRVQRRQPDRQDRRIPGLRPHQLRLPRPRRGRHRLLLRLLPPPHRRRRPHAQRPDRADRHPPHPAGRQRRRRHRTAHRPRLPALHRAQRHHRRPGLDRGHRQRRRHRLPGAPDQRRHRHPGRHHLGHLLHRHRPDRADRLHLRRARARRGRRCVAALQPAHRHHRRDLVHHGPGPAQADLGEQPHPDLRLGQRRRRRPELLLGERQQRLPAVAPGRPGQRDHRQAGRRRPAAGRRVGHPQPDHRRPGQHRRRHLQHPAGRRRPHLRPGDRQHRDAHPAQRRHRPLRPAGLHRQHRLARGPGVRAARLQRLTRTPHSGGTAETPSPGRTAARTRALSAGCPPPSRPSARTGTR
ncbi:hypothetical protein SCOCK_320089 [Actinacidiphila cocklensis]|uniref:Uncharacterized protein n=1 Tax=Actinacidiphila cocklensis TaxID=887465 RepID=A0A9W4DSY4_9ACTN|nr:hypothetical protein SCOCK_320089 [Actinacidiphila cocklensis]